MQVPEEDWICPVCAEHMVEGVFDALTSNPGDPRHDVIGVDRRGAKYWYVARRLWVEDLEGGCCYFSTKEQLEELLQVLDPILYERELVEGINSVRADLEEHMAITLKLTRENKPSYKQSYLELDNNALSKVQEERKALRDKSSEERKLAQNYRDVVVETTLQRVDSEQMDVSESVTAETVSSSDPNIIDDTLSNSESNSTKPTRASTPVILTKPELPPGDHFKLGQEGTYKQYVNQYSEVQHALSRNQVKEDAEKKTKLSHKFSLTDVSTYKWIGATEGSRQTLLSALRATIIKLEETLPHAFMHSNWPILRRPWMQAVNSSSNPGKDFARALTVLVMCIKPSVLLPVWTDTLGHIDIKKTQSQAKEEKKKADKKEKKEREDEEERLKPWMTWVKYTLPVRSLTVTRQKGEDYRAHGRNGWMWLSTSRTVKSQESSKMGMRAGPHRIAVKYTELKSNTSKVVLIEPKACAFLMKVQKERDDKELTRMVTGEELVEEEETGKEKTEEEKRKDNLKRLLDTSRIDIQEPTDDEIPSEGVIDVSAGFQNSARTLYSKNAKKSSLDDLLSRRIQLKNWEMKKIELLNKPKDDAADTKTEDEKEQSTVITSDIVEKVPETESTETWINNSKKKLFDALKLLRDNEAPRSTGQQCYSPSCRAGDSTQCYSITCTVRKEAEVLSKVTDVYTKVIREGKMKEAVKIDLADNFKLRKVSNAKELLTDLVKVLLNKAKELSEETMMSIAPNATKTENGITNGIKTEDETKSEVKSEVKTDGNIGDNKEDSPAPAKPSIKRCYSMDDTAGMTSRYIMFRNTLFNI